jgi:hypothetical protein
MIIETKGFKVLDQRLKITLTIAPVLSQAMVFSSIDCWVRFFLPGINGGTSNLH